MKKPKHTINSSLDSDPGFTIDRDPSPEVLAAELDVPSAVLELLADLEMDLDDDQAKELVQTISDYLLRCGMGRPSLHDSRKKILTLGETFERAVKAIDDLRKTKSILSLFTEEKGRSVWQLQKLRKRLNKACLATKKWAESIPQEPPGNPEKSILRTSYNTS